MRPLADAFNEVRPGPIDLDWLETRLQQAHREAAVAWAPVQLAPATFAQGIARRLSGTPTREQLEELKLVDLYLAIACEKNDPAALAVFERLLLPAISGSVGRVGQAERDEVIQLLRTRLFLSRPGRNAAIFDYQGRGALTAWVRASAVRIALDSRRGAAQAGDPDELHRIGAAAAQHDPEVLLLREEQRAWLTAAIREAFAALSSEERNLLRLSVVEGLSLAQIGVMSQVHESTVSRRVSQARDRLLALAREHLAGKLRLTSSEVDSLLGLDSNVDLSIRHVIAHA